MRLKFTFSNVATMCALFFAIGSSWSQLAYNFTSCSATGSNGPTQAQANTAYTGTNLAGNVTITGGIQYWTVPASGTYKIEAFGGQGYGPFGGRGAHIKGEFILTAGQQIKILVGQKAGDYFNFPAATYNAQFGGGGGSFVTTSTNSPLVVAGGGGGSHGTTWNTVCDGQITNTGSGGATGTTIGTGGTSGNGGNTAASAHGGGGLLSDGLTSAGGGKAFVNGGVGGFQYGFGGFGGGGGTTSWNNFRAGGGGGYSGGGAANNGATCCAIAGGGGSFNGGTQPVNLAGIQIGNGMVVITPLISVPNDAGISSVVGLTPVCNGVYPLQAIVNNFGNNAITSLTVGWRVNGVLQTPYSLSSTLSPSGGGSSQMTINLGNFTMDGNTTIKVWSSMPNGVTDTVNLNDTTTFTFLPMFVSTSLINPINCNGANSGVAKALVSNSTGTMSYSWSNGTSGLYLLSVVAGTYILTATDGTCMDTASIVIFQPAPLAYTSLTTGTNCFGDSTGSSTLSISGGVPNYGVAWANGGSGSNNSTLPAGTHNFTISDYNGCVITGSVNVTQPTSIALTSTGTPVTLGNDGTIDLSVSGGSPSYTYLWSNSATTQDLSGLSSGTYSVTVTDANGCTKTSNYTVTSVVGLDEKSNEFGISVYPNPSNSEFTVALTNVDQKTSIEVFDVLGKKVFGDENPNSTTKIYLNVNDGIYLVKVMYGSNSFIERIVIKN